MDGHRTERVGIPSTNAPSLGISAKDEPPGPSTPSFTPGPWTVAGPNGIDYAILALTTPRTVAHAYTEPDRRLISLAPEMYDCLRAMVADHSEAECSGGRFETADEAIAWLKDENAPTNYGPCWPHRILKQVDG